METQKTDMTQVWKSFGMDTAIGKKLYKMYNYNKSKPAVHYPEIRTKVPKKANAPKEANNPTPVRCASLSSINNPNFQRNPKIKDVPRRKPQTVIEKELDAFEPQSAPSFKGKDRNLLIQNLQNKFKKIIDPISKKALVLPENQIQNATGAMKRLLIEKITGKKTVQANNNEDKEESKKNELSKMFDELMLEIEEKQTLLVELEKKGIKSLYNKTKEDIVERISDLQRITKLLKSSD